MSGTKKTVWVLVSDSVHAQLYTVKSMIPFRVEELRAGHFRGRGEATPHTDSVSHNIKFESGEGPRHHAGRHADPHQIDKEVFVEHLGDFINSANEQKNFDELVVVAPPHALGDLRRGLSADVHKKIKTEIHGEWTKLPKVDLEQHLANHIAQAAT